MGITGLDIGTRTGWEGSVYERFPGMVVERDISKPYFDEIFADGLCERISGLVLGIGVGNKPGILAEVEGTDVFESVKVDGMFGKLSDLIKASAL